MVTDDELRAVGLAYAEAIDAVLPAWVEREVARVLGATGRPLTPALRAAARAAGERAAEEVGGELRRLFDADIEQQRTTPIALLRRAVRFPTAVLAAAGVPPVERDEWSRQAFPDDVYDLGPASVADVDPSLRDAGILWGAAKANLHLSRRGAGPSGHAPRPPRLVALVTDLMDRSRLSAAVGDADVRFVRRADDPAVEAADVVVVDLAQPGSVDAVRALCARGARVVAYGAHVDRVLLEQARAAGAAHALPRSAFFAAPRRWLP